MIFVTLGSQKFQFNRLLKMIDELIEEGMIEEEVFAQIGYSDYLPTNFNYKDFLDRDEFIEYINKCDKVITHGGTGAIITALKNGKKVIAIGRKSQLGEHVDDHQTQIVKEFSELNFIFTVSNKQELGEMVLTMERHSFDEYQSSTNKIIDEIECFINS